MKTRHFCRSCTIYHDGLTNENSRIALSNDPAFNKFGYSSVSGHQSFHPPVTRLRGFRQSLRDRKVKKNSRTSPNLEQRLMFHQGPVSDNSFVRIKIQ